MLLIAVMLLVPALDAFACGLEPATGHSTELAADEPADSPDERGDPESSPGVCAHSHCHHTMANVPSNEALDPSIRQNGALLAFQVKAHRSIVSDGPIKPPRI